MQYVHNPIRGQDYVEEEKVCTLCGRLGQFKILMSWWTHMRTPDLDDRSSSCYHHPFAHQLQECEGCGYVAFDVSEPASPNLKEQVASAAYLEQLFSPDFPWSINRFLCRALLDVWDGKMGYAAQESLKAAWACDDLQNDKAAIHCRLQAAELFRIAAERNQLPSHMAGFYDILPIDLLRRSQRFSDAEKLVWEAFKRQRTFHPLARKILYFEHRLNRARDSGRHNMKELPRDR